jgi:hypothetical protein
MHDLGDMLVAAGFGDPVMDMEMITLTYPGPRGFLADQRHLGVRDGLLGPRAGATGVASSPPGRAMPTGACRRASRSSSATPGSPNRGRSPTAAR